jgi:hypothetical protein
VAVTDFLWKRARRSTHFLDGDDDLKQLVVERASESAEVPTSSSRSTWIPEAADAEAHHRHVQGAITGRDRVLQQDEEWRGRGTGGRAFDGRCRARTRQLAVLRRARQGPITHEFTRSASPRASESRGRDEVEQGSGLHLLQGDPGLGQEEVRLQHPRRRPDIYSNHKIAGTAFDPDSIMLYYSRRA